MSPIYFPNHKIRIYRLEDSEEEFYGEKKKVLRLVGEVMADFQRSGDRERILEYGDKESSHYTLYLPLTTDIRYDDRVKVEGYDFLLRVSSEPHTFPLLSYKRVSLQKQEQTQPPEIAEEEEEPEG